MEVYQSKGNRFSSLKYEAKYQPKKKEEKKVYRAVGRKKSKNIKPSESSRSNCLLNNGSAKQAVIKYYVKKESS